MHSIFTVFRRADADLTHEDGAISKITRAIDETGSDEMGGGFFRVTAQGPERTLPYTELAVCVEGTLRLTVAGETHTLAAGDFAWLPEGTKVAFDGDEAVCVYAVHPVDWRTRSA